MISRTSARRVPRAAALLAAAALAVATVSCRLDESGLRTNLLAQSSGAEKLFFLEEVLSADPKANPAELARDAAEAGHVNVLTYLASRGADLKASDAEGMSPILLAARTGKFAAVRYLVEIVGADVRAKNRDKVTCLMLAAGSGSLDISRYLLDRGANPKAKSNHGTTALMYAASSGNVELAKLLAERGADTRMRDNFGNTALEYAADQAMADCLRGLGLE